MDFALKLTGLALLVLVCMVLDHAVLGGGSAAALF
jgi:hypothetical protein